MLKFKKLISVLMIAFIMLGVVQPVFAASGTGTWVGQQNVFTQQYILEVIDNADDTFLDADVQAQYESFKADVNNKCY